MSKNKNSVNGDFDLVFPNHEDWPIYQLSQDRKAFTQSLIDHSTARIHELTESDSSLKEELEKAIYLERIRLKQVPWKVDKPEEKKFWNDAKRRLLKKSGAKDNGNADQLNANLLNEILDRYSNEIIGNFKIKTYNFATKVVPIGFSRLLNAASAKRMNRLWGSELKLYERIKIMGYIEEIRNLSKKGTVILAPTHFSNLDSILIGWSISHIGLPPFLYGAGLNLFNNKILAYFMGNLGAYKIDRRKRNLLYLETLKTYSRLSIEYGCHTLFFPGGTRSRSGALESKLKLGLLGTIMDAQRNNFKNGNNRKIFVVPLILGYNFVLEAASLIDSHLKRSGKEKYYTETDSYPSTLKATNFMWKFFAAKADLRLYFGKPMDLFGNDVDGDGNSLDKKGKELDIRSYFESNGKITADSQRDSEYTKRLGDIIIDRFHKENMVLSSHLVAYCAFEILNKKHRRLDLYGLLRLPEEDRNIPYQHFAKVVSALRQRLKEMEVEGKLLLGEHMYGDIDRLIKHGLQNLGIYHSKRTLRINKEGDIASDDLKLLYYYHNRLNGYGLDQYI